MTWISFVITTFEAHVSVIYPRERCHVVVPTHGPVNSSLGIEPGKHENSTEYRLTQHGADDGRAQASQRLHDGGRAIELRKRFGTITASGDNW